MKQETPNRRKSFIVALFLHITEGSCLILKFGFIVLQKWSEALVLLEQCMV